MAYAQDKALVRATRVAARKLRVAASWAGTGQPVNVSDDFVLELYVLFRLTHDLCRSYRVRYDPGTGAKRHEFPRSPAQKNGRPRFFLCDPRTGVALFQLCAGTKISDIHGYPRAPDISVQDGNAPSTPSYTHVLLIWDAKHRKDPTDRITHHELSEVGRWIDLLDLHGAARTGLALHRLGVLLGNCIISNGQFSTEPDAELARLDVKEVSGFHPKSRFAVRP